MESKSFNDRSLSPQKKFKASSTSNTEISMESNCSSLVETSNGSDSHSPTMNGLAPTRSGRFLSSHIENSYSSSPQENSSQSNSTSSVSNIQEEVVSSSENSLCGKQSTISHEEKDADSVTNAEPGEVAVDNETTEEKK